MEAGAGAAGVMPGPKAKRPVAPEEQAACPEMSQGVVGRCVRSSSPQGAPPAAEEEDEVEEIERKESIGTEFLPPC